MLNELKRCGRQTAYFPTAPSIRGIGTVAGKKESNGPLGAYFDVKLTDSLCEKDTWEKAERKMLVDAVDTVLNKTETSENEIDRIIMGDLLNQIISASYAASEVAMPFTGVYGACSTMALALGTAAMLVDSGYCRKTIAATASHFCTAERQYRFPLEMGVQRTPSSQWTTTGAGACLIVPHEPAFPSITYFTNGVVVNFDVSDVNNMGAAMAPAAAETLRAHFEETGRGPDYYDEIITGDLGLYGSRLLEELLEKEFPDFAEKHFDCGCELFKGDKSVKAGASGAGCSALYLSRIFRDMVNGNVKKVLFTATGALHSPTALFQKESIPGIAHAVAIETEA